MDGRRGDEAGERFLAEMDARRLSRREFVRGALAGSAALSLPTLLAACGGDDDEGAERAETTKKAARGGRLRVAVVGGGSAEDLNPNKGFNEIDVARHRNLYESLTEYAPDGSVRNALAEELEPNDDATVWTLRLRQGVTWHDGSPFTAADVVYSLKYIIDPKNEAAGASSLSFLKPNNIRRVDDATVELTLETPHSLLPTVLGERTLMMFKEGTTDFTKPNGTGPFKFQSWTRGQRSLFARNENYWQDGKPLLDELEIISIDEASARMNALVAGEIDALAQLDFNLIETVEANENLALIDAESGAYTCQYMQVTSAPFTDVRVRKALRMMVDREQLIENTLAGHGRLGNDLPAWFDPDYADDLEQIEYDPEQAKALLQEAGQENLSVSLATSDVAPAMLQSSTLLVEQAKAAGVSVKLDKAPTDQYWSTHYLKKPFACTNWGGRPLISHLLLGYTSNAPYNETVWKRKEWDGIVNEALRTTDETQRRELLHEAQRIQWDEGGYIIWGFLNNVDAISKKVGGIGPSVIRPLNYYDFREASITS